MQENESQTFPPGVEGDVHAPSLNLTKTLRGRRIPILNVRNLEFREVKQPAHHHTATMWRSQAPSPGLCSPRIPSVVPRPATSAVPSPWELVRRVAASPAQTRVRPAFRQDPGQFVNTEVCEALPLRSSPFPRLLYTPKNFPDC